jgi:hypothetical protein
MQNKHSLAQQICWKICCPFLFRCARVLASPCRRIIKVINQLLYIQMKYYRKIREYFLRDCKYNFALFQTDSIQHEPFAFENINGLKSTISFIKEFHLLLTAS